MIPGKPALLRERSTLLQNLTCAGCILFGLVLITQVQVAGDGAWFWYAKLFLQGRHLYGDLHLALQPLYVLVTAANMRLFGDGWLVSKLPAALMVIAYAIGLRLVAGRSSLGDGVKAILLAIGFTYPLYFVAYRYDDYHVMADCFQLYSILLLLQLPSVSSRKRELGSAAALGVLSSLSMMSRLNDGGLLFLSVFVCLLAMAPLQKWLAAAVFACSCLVATLAVIACSGDSIATYAYNSIFRAAGAKGGTATLLSYPAKLFGLTIDRFHDEPLLRHYALIILVVFILVGLCCWFRFKWISQGVCAAVATIAIVLGMIKTHRWQATMFPIVLTGIMALLAYFIGAAVLGEAVFKTVQPQTRHWNRYRLLLLIPIGQMISGSLSSGGHFDSLCAPVGILLLLLPFAYPTLFQWPPWRYGYAAVVAMTVLSCLDFKRNNPFSWHTYQTPPMLKGRVWYHHPQYGPMVIDTKLLDFIEPVCARVHDAPNTSLLTLPFPFPNYFCAVPPWHDAVQTFFDTSTAETVGKVETDLKAAPPRFIVYQRQTQWLRIHEVVFNQGRRLPQRALDELLQSRLASGQWSALRQQCMADADWILLETVPPASLPPDATIRVQWVADRCPVH